MGDETIPPRYTYSVVDNTYVVRWSSDSCEKLSGEGAWVPHDDLWDVATNGRPLANEEEAIRRWEEILRWNQEHGY